jgi:hypothetical protein
MKEDVVVWLKHYLLASGPQPAEIVKAAAFDAGYSRFEIKDARLLLMVESKSVVYWFLPKEQE